MGVDHHVALAQLASQLMKNQRTARRRISKVQLDMAESQMKQDQTAQQGQDKPNGRRCCRPRRRWRRTAQNMAKIAERPRARR